MAASDYKNYNEELQKLFLEFCATDPELFVRVKNIVKKEIYKNAIFLEFLVLFNHLLLTLVIHMVQYDLNIKI